MSVTHVFAGAVLATIAVASSAAAQDYAPGYEHGAMPLPPISGTIHLRSHPHWASRHAHRFAHAHWLPENLAWGSRHFPRVAGYQGGLGRQIWHQTYNSAGAEAFWNRNVEFYGEGNDTLALTVTGWGTADSATTGGAYPPPSPWHSASAPFASGYAGGTGQWSGLHRRRLGYAPTGGLGYYSSGSSAGPYGSTGGLAYYSSSSSAGPNGSPGGLGIYSSGSYGPGPEILHVGGTGSAAWTGGCNCAPHVLHVGRDESGVVQD